MHTPNLFVIFLRAINVSGKNIVKMSELKAKLNALKIGDFRTYIQSGNILYSGLLTIERIEKEIETIVRNDYGIETNMIGLSIDALSEIVGLSPYSECDTKRSFIFLGRKQWVEKDMSTPPTVIKDEKVSVVNGYLYLHYPGGQGASRLTTKIIERHYGTTGTMRNMNTIRNIIALATE